MSQDLSLRARYRLRLTRKRLLWFAFRKRRQLTNVTLRSAGIASSRILLFATIRNEMLRLPHFLAHYRALGVGHFLIVSNDSTDGSDMYLSQQPDVSLWQTEHGYKAARFGMDWLTWLQRRYADGKWALTVDADELLIYPDWEMRGLDQLTAWLDQNRLNSFPAMLLDLYPKGSPDSHDYTPDQDPLGLLNWFDATGYWSEKRGRHRTETILGGVRARSFFADHPDKSPTLSKVPLLKWRKSYAYLSSTHVVLPPPLNTCLDAGRTDMPSGILLHTKFLPGTGDRAREDKARGQQYTKWPAHDAYYDALADAPDMWTPSSTRLQGWQQLVDLDLMRRGTW